jgi:hypothetical protein
MQVRPHCLAAARAICPAFAALFDLALIQLRHRVSRDKAARSLTPSSVAFDGEVHLFAFGQTDAGKLKAIPAQSDERNICAAWAPRPYYRFMF